MSVRRLNAYMRAEAASPLLRSAYSLMLNAAVTAGLGLAFWLVAARLFEADDVGRDAALIAVMVELSTICQLNLVNAVTRFLPNLARGTARALLIAYGASGALAFVLAVGFVTLAPLASDEFAFFEHDLRFAALFVVAQVGWGWFVIQDAALTATRRAPWVLVENTAFGALKLLALPLLLVMGSGHGVFLAWMLPALLLLVPVNVFLFRRIIPAHVREHRPTGSFLRALGRGRLLRFMALDYGASVFGQGAATVLPVLVVALLGGSANAYFYVPYTIVTAFIMLFYGASSSLVVEGALAEHRIPELAATLARRFALIVVPGTVVMVAAAPLVLLPFGADYAREGTSVLRLLACACLFRVTVTLYVAIARLYGQGARILAVEGARAGLLLAGAAILAGPMGLDGIALAYLLSSAVVAVAVLPWLARFFRSPSTPPGPAPARVNARRRVGLGLACVLLALGAAVTVIEPLASYTPRDEQRAGVARSTLVWADEFDGPEGARPNPRKWGAESGHGWGNGELQEYTGRRANVSLDGRGHLRMTARRKRIRHPDGVTTRFTSARIDTERKFEFAYGRIEARIRVPRGRGLLPAFWALGNNLDSAGWPASGEIDIMEVNGAKPRLVSGTLHGPRRGHKDFAVGGERRTTAPLSKAFHVYGVVWSPHRIAFTFDREVYAVFRRSSLPSGSRWSFKRPFFLLLTLPVGGSWLGPPDATTRWPATMLIDWVRVRSNASGPFCPRVRAPAFRKRCPRTSP